MKSIYPADHFTVRYSVPLKVFLFRKSTVRQTHTR